MIRSLTRLAPVLLTALAAVACGGSDSATTFKDGQGNNRTAAQPSPWARA